MNIVESTIVTVYNYSDSYASFPTQIKPDGYLFEPTLGEEPFAIPISFSEIRVANSQSNIFREGILRFDPEMEKEVYEKLGIRDWEEILSDREIRTILLRPTRSGLEKIVKITSTSLLERVRGLLIMLENSGTSDISLRVKNVVTQRYFELYKNQRKSDIVITATESESETAKSLTEDEVAKIKEELSAKIRAEIEEEMKKEANRENEMSLLRESIRAELLIELEKDSVSKEKESDDKPKRQYNKTQS